MDNFPIYNPLAGIRAAKTRNAHTDNDSPLPILMPSATTSQGSDTYEFLSPHHYTDTTKNPFANFYANAALESQLNLSPAAAGDANTTQRDSASKECKAPDGTNEGVLHTFPPRSRVAFVEPNDVFRKVNEPFLPYASQPRKPEPKPEHDVESGHDTKGKTVEVIPWSEWPKPASKDEVESGPTTESVLEAQRKEVQMSAKPWIRFPKAGTQRNVERNPPRKTVGWARPVDSLALRKNKTEQ